MITRQDLEDYRFRETLLEQQFSKLKMWQNKLTRLQTAYGSASRSAIREDPNSTDQIRQIVDSINMDIDQLSRKYKEVDALIGQIPEPKIRAVMTQYYVLCASDWYEVAAVVGISVRTAHRLHGYGLEIIRHMQE